MSDNLFSASWYRVAELKPRLRSHVQVHRHQYRGQAWYFLEDPASGRSHRFGPAAWHLIGLMDGERTVQTIWDTATARLGDEAPTQDDTIQLLGQLHAADAIHCDVLPDTLELFRRHRKQERQKWKQRLWSPLAVRFPLFDPDRFLARWLTVGEWLFSRTGAVLWLIVVSAAAVLAGLHWEALTSGGIDELLAPQNLLALWITYPVVKALHELGHGFAVKRWGGEVHEMGIMLLVLMPIPYVDASSASAFREKRKRVVVSAAGVLVEVFLAAVAMIAWAHMEPGMARSIAYNVILIGSVSTVLFNLNPLLRFDGYYMLADAIEIPNLGTRSNKYLGYLFQRYAFGWRDAESPVTAPGERAWFVGYGIAAFCYRMFIMFVIVVFIAGQFFFVGVLLALWAIATQIFVPLGKVLKFAFTDTRIRRHRVRGLSVGAVLVLGIAALLVLAPAPLFTRAEGVVWLPEHAHVRAGAAGFVRRVLAQPGDPVREGQLLLELDDPLLAAQVRVLETRVRELEARLTAHDPFDPSRAAVLRQELASARSEVSRARERLSALAIRSPSNGRLVLPRAQDLEGRFLQQGDRIAYVTRADRARVRVVVNQDEIGLVRERTLGVQARLPDYGAGPVTARIRREVPGGGTSLPAAALGSGGGGRLAIDPRDADGLRTLERVFQLDLDLDEQVTLDLVGTRLHVRFDHGSEPLAAQWYRSLRQLLLREFGV